MSNRNNQNEFRQSHPAMLIAAARDSSPPLDQWGYTSHLLTLMDAAKSIGADDWTLTDSLVREIVVAVQDAAIARATEGVAR